MKKYYFLLAATTMMFAACAQTDMVNEVVTEEAPQAIGFETFAEKATRAENSNSAYSWILSDHHTTFKVWASKNVSTGYVNVYNGGIVTYNTTWTADPLKYWDKTATSYEFYAAAPSELSWVATDIDGADGYLKLENYQLYGTTNDNLASSPSSVSWKGLNSETNKDIDLMIADECTHGSIGSDVTLNFIHILSKLNIQVKKGAVATGEYDPTIVLTGLEVCGLKNKGTFNESIASAVNTKPGSNARWQNTTEGSVSPTVQGEYKLSAYLGAASGETPATLTLTTSAVPTHKYLIIPQTVTGSSVNVASNPGGAYLKISYTVDEEAYETYYSLAAAFNTASLAFNEGWENTLTITIAPDVIKFIANAAPWAEGTSDDDTTIK